MIQFRYRLTMMLLLITLVGIIVTYDFDFTFAFHRPNSGYTIIEGQLYANNGTDNKLDLLLIQPGNNTNITFANASTIQRTTGAATDGNFPVQQSMNGTQNVTSSSSSSSSSSDITSHLNLAKQAVEVGDPDTIIKELGVIEQQLLPLVANSSATDGNFPVQQSMNGTQNVTSSSSSSSSSSDITSHLNLAKQAVEVGDPDTIIKELGVIEQQLLPLVANNNTSAFSTMSNYSSTDLKELNDRENEPANVEEFLPEEEERPQSSTSQRDPPQRTRNYE